MDKLNPTNTETVTDTVTTNQEEKNITATTNQPDEQTKDTKDTNVGNDLKDKLKQLSSEHKLNLFDREGVVALAEVLKEAKNTTVELQAKTEALTKENTELKQAQEAASARYKALALGFTEDNMAEAFALAEVNKPEGETIEQGLARVKETYGVLFNQKATQVGLLHNDTQRQQEEKKMTEAERYMAKNPKYQTYYKK